MGYIRVKRSTALIFCVAVIATSLFLTYCFIFGAPDIKLSEATVQQDIEYQYSYEEEQLYYPEDNYYNNEESDEYEHRESFSENGYSF